MKSKWLVSAAALLAIAAFGFSQALVRLEARMTGAGDDKGKARWSVKGSQSELQVEAENLTPNEVFTIVIDANAPWTAETDAFGALRLTQRWRGANRPNVSNGSTVTIRDDQGMSVLSGTLRGR